MTDEAAVKVVRVIDPDNVREIAVTGASNISRLGQYVQIIHTVTRSDTEALFANRPQPPNFVVVARLLINPDSARALAKSILSVVGDGGDAGGNTMN